MLAISIAPSWFFVCYVSSISGVGCTKCSDIVSMCTPSSNYTIVDSVHLLAWAAHSSSKSFVGFSPFQTRYCGCRPNLIKFSCTIFTNLGLNLPRQRLHGHLNFCTPNLCAQVKSHVYNLSSWLFCWSMSFSWSCISFAKFAKHRKQKHP